MQSFNLSQWAVHHPSFVLFLIIAASVAGVQSYFNLGRAEDPSFVIKTMVVQAVWPGATAEEMQFQVAEPIEKRLQELPQLDIVKTYSRPSVTVLQVQLKDAIRGPEVNDVWYQVRKKIGDSRKDLPQGVQGPFFNDEYGDVYSAIYMLSGVGVSRADLKRYAEQMRKALLRVENVSKVTLVGDIEQRIYIEFSHRKLATLGISPEAIFESVRRQNAIMSAGAIETRADHVRFRLSGAFDGVEAVAAVPILAGGRIIRLGDIAEIKRDYEDPPSLIVRHNREAAIGVAVAMAANANMLEFGRSLDAAISALKAEIPLGVAIEKIADQPRVVAESVGEFLQAFAEALTIVLAVSFLTLGWRTGIVVALSVPLVLAFVFVAMDAAGMNFDRITLGALILALGLLVDDAIIAIEMMVVKMEQGLNRFNAATVAWISTAMPMLTGTLVTAAGFLPVGFAQSTAGEYAGNIFWVVGLALVVSWIVAVVFTPYLGVKLLPDFARVASNADPNTGKLQAHSPLAMYDSRAYRALRRAVRWVLRRRWSIILATLLALAGSIAGMGLVQQQFFPISSRPELLIEVRMPEGASISATSAAAIKAEALLADDADVQFFTTYVGQGSPRFYLSLNPVLPNESYSLIVVMTPGTEARERLKAKLEAAIAQGAVPEARVRVDRLNFGPPVGFPVQFRVVGPDPAKVRAIAADVRELMRRNPHTRDVQFDWNEMVKQVRLEIDHDRVRKFGLNAQEISQTLQTLLTGATITEYREGTDLIDVVARAVPEERNLDSLADLTVLTRNGKAIPLSQIGRLTFGFEEPILWRRNRDLVLTVRADVAPGLQPPTVTRQILPQVDSLALPPGYRIEVGGAIEESTKANAALFKLFPLMFLIMLLLLMIQLQSFTKLFFVFSTAPLGLIGTVAALIVFDAPFGFMALLGIIALAGMIMRNTLILVDQIDKDLSAGLAPHEAIIESTVRRARPIVVTALAAILAMIPLSRSVFFGPMAIAMMGGLLVATVLTLVFVPALYAAWFRVKDARHDEAAWRRSEPLPAG